MNLTDQYGRRIKKLRVSLTDKCNLRCHYCMPVNQKFMEEDKFLSPLEYYDILEELSQYGLEEVRLTGGEPLLGKSFSQIAEIISSFHFKKVGITTNGILIDRYIDTLIKNKIYYLNVSLDSLDPSNFKSITNGDYLSQVVSNVRKARDAGLSVKINVVAMKGINDHEVLNFVSFAENEKIEVRFLELMRIGYACKDQSKQFISADELISQIKIKYDLKSIMVPNDSTSYSFLTSTGAVIGFIASESKPFCGNCSRWRLSADGILRSCLLKNDGLSIRNKSPDERKRIYKVLLQQKPYLRPAEVSHHMNMIGG
jgi:cyclic pyranopterin phosphate synthase